MSWQERLEQLEKRIERIERALNLAPPPAEPEPKRVVVPPPLPTRSPIPAESAEVGPAPVAPVPVLPATPPAQVEYEQPAIPIARKADSRLEQTIGLKWAGWIGAVVLIIGAASGIKFAYDQGWLGGVPPIARLGLMAMAGMGLIAIGEWVYRRINALSAVGLFGAGVAVFFLVSYAGHGFYELYASKTAFALMAISTLVGAAVAMRGKFASVAVLALIGGNIAPMALSSGEGRLPTFLGYLLMLEAVALFLAYWGASTRWWTLRGLSLVTNCLWLGLLLAEMSVDERTGIITAFMVLFALLHHGEVVASTLRQRASGTAGVVFTVMVNAALVVGILLAFRESTEVVRGMWVLGMAAVCGVAGFLIRRPTSDDNAPAVGHALSIGFRVQAVGLVVVAGAVLLSGVWLVVGWGVLAIVLAAVGARLDLRISRIGAMVVWVLACAYLVLRVVAGASDVGRELVTIGNEIIPVYWALGAALMAMGHLIGWLIGWGKEGDEARAGVLISILASAVLVGVSVAGLDAAWASGVMLAYAWILAAGAAMEGTRHLRLGVQMGVVLGAVGLKWMAYDTLGTRLSPGFQAVQQLPGLNATFIIGLLIALSLLVVYWNGRKRAEATGNLHPALSVVGMTAVIMILWAVSFEIDRYFERRGVLGGQLRDARLAKQVGWSIFWGIYAIAAVILGFAIKRAPLRYFGLGLFALTLFKIVIVDLASIGTGYRILSFMGLGLLLLGTSVLYGKFSPRLLGDEMAGKSTT